MDELPAGPHGDRQRKTDLAPDGIEHEVRAALPDDIPQREGRFDDMLDFTLAIATLGAASIAFSVHVGRRVSTAIPTRTRKALTPLVAGPASVSGET